MERKVSYKLSENSNTSPGMGKKGGSSENALEGTDVKREQSLAVHVCASWKLAGGKDGQMWGAR